MFAGSSLGWGFLQPFFGGGTKITIGAESAVETRLRIKLPHRNRLCDLHYPAPGLAELEFVAAGDDRTVAFQVVEDQVVGAISPFLACCQSIDRELKTLVGIFL